ncbi:MAG: hypothetical protein ACRDPH_08650 [Marmoricola sp.]
MKAKAMLLLGGVVGYVLGTRDGRERYDQMKTQAQGVWDHPKVQDARTRAQRQAPGATGTSTGPTGSDSGFPGPTSPPG